MNVHVVVSNINIIICFLGRIAWFVCVVTRMCPAQMAEPIEMPFGKLTFMGPGNHVLDGGQDQMNPFAAVMGTSW